MTWVTLISGPPSPRPAFDTVESFAQPVHRHGFLHHELVVPIQQSAAAFVSAASKR
ncbi:hypothetical protein VUR80DRAFT_9705 [Thermomyces stellatus]